ncbi:MAG: hypothetical protein JWM11_4009 [Planctomycetaceae bacterium]|nr:hypothetical protein [Planctomycetaceae bacterium]
MPEYCTSTQVENRLKAAGYFNVADDDDDGSVSDNELAANITTGIQWAGGKIDYYVINRSPAYDPMSLRNGGNAWCSQRAIDLAAWHAVTNGGRDCADSLQAAKDEALEELKAVKDDADVIPGAVIGQDFNSNSHETFHIVSEYLT